MRAGEHLGITAYKGRDHFGEKRIKRVIIRLARARPKKTATV